MARAAKGLRALVRTIDLLAASPLVRARQTADIVAAAYGIQVGEPTDVLTPDASLPRFTKWAAPHAGAGTLAVVGHEPHLSTLATWLIAGVEDSRLKLKKGGACLLEFDDLPVRAGATLLWLVTPATLRDLGA